ncbi:hypothetical protein [Amycolatopsis sp. cmx-4-54]|uniref:hypothetical protein n=1 Tax=Amycolatopsis sp. cmx-4-54 TaxID=2790936 RepID=UPI00397AC301
MFTTTIVASTALSRWDVKSVLSKNWEGSKEAQRPIGRFVRRRREENIDANGVRYGSIHFDGSVSLRAEGTKIAGKTWIARADDLVFSKIDIRNGAIAVIPKEFESIAFSSEYPIYDVHVSGGFLPEFLQILCRTKIFRSQVEALAVGHSGRRRVTPESFEDLLIPVVGKSTQRRIVDQYRRQLDVAEQLIVDAVDTEGLTVRAFMDALGLVYRPIEHGRKFVAVESGSLYRWTFRSAMSILQGGSALADGRYRSAPLGSGDLSVLKRGVSKSPRNRPGDNARPYIRVANIQKWGLDLSDVKEIDVPPSSLKSLRINAGDILICRNNSMELVGKAALWEGQIEDCVHDDHVFRLALNLEELHPEYVNAFLATPLVRAWFQGRAQMTTNLAGITGDAVVDMPIPLPPIRTQENLGREFRDGLMKAHSQRMDATKLVEQALSQAELEIAAAHADGRVDF